MSTMRTKRTTALEEQRGEVGASLQREYLEPLGVSVCRDSGHAVRATGGRLCTGLSNQAEQLHTNPEDRKADCQVLQSHWIHQDAGVERWTAFSDYSGSPPTALGFGTFRPSLFHNSLTRRALPDPRQRVSFKRGSAALCPGLRAWDPFCLQTDQPQP
ncbi:unnamed protein product [Gadus morhua 'NCC']